MSFISFPTDPNTMNRSEIQQTLVDCIVDGMDMEMLCQLACDTSPQLMMVILIRN